jgi:hypothetical protein
MAMTDPKTPLCDVEQNNYCTGFLVNKTTILKKKGK